MNHVSSSDEYKKVDVSESNQVEHEGRNYMDDDIADIVARFAKSPLTLRQIAEQFKAHAEKMEDDPKLRAYLLRVARDFNELAEPTSSRLVVH